MLDEAKNINKSLSSLGNVISALAEGTVSNSTSPVQNKDFSVVCLIEIHLFNMSYYFCSFKLFSPS